MPDDQEQDVIESEDDQTQDTEPPAGDDSRGDEEEPEPKEDEEELEVSIDGEEEVEPEPESNLLNDLRQRHRNLKKKYRQTLHELEKVQAPQGAAPIDPGPKPTLEQCDYDSDQYESKLSDWFAKKRAVEDHEKQTAAQKEKENQEWQKIYARYGERKQALRVKDYDEAEQEIIEQLDIPKQNLLVKYAEKPEIVVYALYKNPAKLSAMSRLDQFEFVKELGRLESTLKVGKRKPKTQPEKTIQSTGTLSGTTDRTLEKLREEAARTGNMSKVLKYKRDKKRRAAAG